MATQDLILSIVASEQGFLASILSAEASKAEKSAALVTPLDFTGEDPNTILSKALSIEKSISRVIRAAADKEIAIAAKVAAIFGNTVGPITWKACCPADCNDKDDC